VVAQRCWGEFQELARKHTIEALDVLVQIMLNEKAPPNARVAAANTLLDRAYGKAPTFSTSDTQAFKRAIDMTDDELAAIAARAKLIEIRASRTLSLPGEIRATENGTSEPGCIEDTTTHFFRLIAIGNAKVWVRFARPFSSKWVMPKHR
jgi:hypothetical protein